MNVEQMKKEIENLGISPAAEKMYPITSDWVPISDVLAIVDRFEKYWESYKTTKGKPEGELIEEVLGKS